MSDSTQIEKKPDRAKMFEQDGNLFCKNCGSCFWTYAEYGKHKCAVARKEEKK